MKKYGFLTLIALFAFVGSSWAGSGQLARDRWERNNVQGFAPYSTVSKVGTKFTYIFTDAVLFYRINCATVDSFIRFNSQSATYPIVKNTEYTFIRPSAAIQFTMSSADNTCKILIH